MRSPEIPKMMLKVLGTCKSSAKIWAPPTNRCVTSVSSPFSARPPTLGSCLLCTELVGLEPVSPVQRSHTARPCRCRLQPLLPRPPAHGLCESHACAVRTPPRPAGPRSLLHGGLARPSAARDPAKWHSTLPADCCQVPLGRGEREKDDGVLCLHEVTVLLGTVCNGRSGSGSRWCAPWWRGGTWAGALASGSRWTQGLCRCLPLGANLLICLKPYFFRNLDT